MADSCCIAVELAQKQVGNEAEPHLKREHDGRGLYNARAKYGQA